MKQRSCLKANAGFTILDGVIILIVIAGVAAVVFPMFARTGGHARRDDCSNNLKECAIALQMYWADYNNTLPSSAIVSRSNKWNKADFVHFGTKLGQVPVPTTARPTTWVQALYPYMKSSDIMFCPTDPTDHTSPNSNVSYYWKLAIDKAWYGVGCKKPCRDEADFAFNADQIIFYERAGFHDDHPGDLGNGVRINVVYLDSHVKIATLANCVPGSVADPTSIGEPMYFNYDQDKPRGPNNPPSPKIPAKYTDPAKYSDMLP